MKQGHGFVVVLISKGREVADRPEVYQVGTYAEIFDWENLDSGLLGIKIKGVNPVRIIDTTCRDDGLVTGHIEAFDNSADVDSRIGDEHAELAETLRSLSKHPYVMQRYPDIDYSSAADVCYRLGELLPVTNITRQNLLETRDISQLLTKLHSIINQLAS